MLAFLKVNIGAIFLGSSVHITVEKRTYRLSACAKCWSALRQVLERERERQVLESLASSVHITVEKKADVWASERLRQVLERLAPSAGARALAPSAGAPLLKLTSHSQIIKSKHMKVLLSSLHHGILCRLDQYGLSSNPSTKSSVLCSYFSLWLAAPGCRGAAKVVISSSNIQSLISFLFISVVSI